MYHPTANEADETIAKTITNIAVKTPIFNHYNTMYPSGFEPETLFVHGEFR